ncbi:hydantoinase/oxoprolinase N-terminal domain-containing protein [Kineobactrum salinum]|uniref:Hydantoinase/oxoprolinase family protein n=1 Tax=Kineobactrum salinum TaxID=2708301 RepID=A0A6C0U4D6_9GAMM|nr:hydantoinase/oxoprolinase family protein [Kineobactrum salinum]QIB67020.1 hydantoinase/oxoprolinase family protein [Kineobactrum salinum]
MRIGVDVGGTNTDAVLMRGDKVLASCKKPTTSNVSDGIVAAIETVLGTSSVPASDVRAVMIGTTHFTNAFVERRNLLDVGVLRVALPAARGIPPLIDWPEAFLAEIGSHCEMVTGGYHFDGRLNAAMDERAVAAAARTFQDKGIRSVAVTGLFSPVNPSMEERAAEILRQEMGDDVAITLSHEIGRIGLLERENATVMNACLVDMSRQVVASFRHALKTLGITAPFYISQNDGTLMDSGMVERYPVLTFASGPTNSMRGAAYLSGLQEALVADIGGTTTDIGMLCKGFPRESSVTVDIGGVRTNFRMPDILALGLGGGSLVREQGSGITIGPRSVGYQLTQKALVFGGDTLTASDIAVAAGYADFGDATRVRHLSADLIEQSVVEIHRKIAEGIDRMKVSAELVPLVLVGGGSVLVDRDIPGVSEVVTPNHAGVANAIGASIAQVSGEIDRVFSYEELGREAALATATEEAVKRARHGGADPETIKVIDIEELPLAYVPGGAVRLRVKVAGALAFDQEQP